MQRAEIRIEGHLDAKWAEWLEGFDFTYTETGDTLLIGNVLDQSALYGLIAKLRDLGVKLKAVNFDLFSPDEQKREDTK
jgi:hypothetical protein